MKADPKGKTHLPGGKVTVSGIYQAKHHRHRLPHEATLLEGELFPVCRFCGALVRFRLVRGARSADQDEDFAPHSGAALVG